MVADNQFCALGLTLVSELAKVRRIIEPPAYAVGSLGVSPSAIVEEEQGREQAQAQAQAQQQDGNAQFLAEDFGEAVPRLPTSILLTARLQSNTADRETLLTTGETGRATFPAAMGDTQGRSDPIVPAEEPTRATPRSARRPRRKGMNAIDDLFSRLE